MLDCHACRERMLDHLYDLLEEAEQRSLLDHVAACADCQAALESARSQQARLARAARLHFPDVHFSPPTEETVTLPAARSISHLHRYVGWAIAAGLLLALGGIGASSYLEHRSARTIVQEREDRLALAHGELEAARQEMEQAEQERQERNRQIEEEIQARKLRLIVTGPRNLPPGAPADYFVRSLDLNGQPTDAEVVARLAEPTAPMSAAATSRFSETRTQGSVSEPDANKLTKQLTVTPEAPGTYRVRIPPDAQLKPGQSLSMVIDARKKSAVERDADDKREQVSLTGQVQLTSPVYLTHLTTDRPIYQPGDVVRFRSLTLDRHLLTPPPEEFHPAYNLVSPDGAVRSVARGATQPMRGREPMHGVGAGEVELDPSSPEGEYELIVHEERNRFPPVARKFLVQRRSKLRLEMKLDFLRADYKPGDQVQARLSVRDGEGTPWRNRSFEVAVSIDNQFFNLAGQPASGPLRAQTDKDGTSLIRFRLPQAIERRKADLIVKIEDKGEVETFRKPIPLVLDSLDVEFYPEGGELVAGLSNRVYFQVRTPSGKPTSIRGTVLEDGQPTELRVGTIDGVENVQGRGLFTLTPRAGKRYELRIDSPSEIKDAKALPEVAQSGVVLRIDGGVFQADEPIPVQVFAGQPRTFLVGAYCRGQLLDTVQIDKGTSKATLKPTLGTGGVCRVTVFDVEQNLKPVAERLIYRHPRERLNVSIQSDRVSYAPGQKPRIAISTTAENVVLTPSIALVSVVDQSALRRDVEPSKRTMPTYFLLTTEIGRADDLEDADFLLTDQPEATVALDLLLGTQGWRRFVEQNPVEFRAAMRQKMSNLTEPEIKRSEAEAERLLVLTGQSQPQSTDLDSERFNRVEAEYKEQLERAEARQRAAEEAIEAASFETEHLSAQATLRVFEMRLERMRAVGLPLLAITLVFVVIGAVIAAKMERLPRSWLSLGTMAACGLLLVVVWNLPVSLTTTQEYDAEPVLARANVMPDAARNEAAVLPRELARGVDQAEAIAPFAAATAPGMGGRDESTVAPPPRALGGAIPSGPADRSSVGGGGLGAAMPSAALLDLAKPASDLMAARGGLSTHRLEQPPQRSVTISGRPMEFGTTEGKSKELVDRQLSEEKKQDEAPKAALLKYGGQQENQETMIFREYAHERKSSIKPGETGDFTRTLYWHPVLLLNEGKNQIEFELSDLETAFQVTVFAHTRDGRLGAGSKIIESRAPSRGK